MTSRIPGDVQAGERVVREMPEHGVQVVVPQPVRVGRTVVDRFLVASGYLNDGHDPRMPTPLPNEALRLVGQVAALASRRIATERQRPVILVNTRMSLLALQADDPAADTESMARYSGAQARELFGHGGQVVDGEPVAAVAAAEQSEPAQTAAGWSGAFLRRGGEFEGQQFEVVTTDPQEARASGARMARGLGAARAARMRLAAQAAAANV